MKRCILPLLFVALMPAITLGAGFGIFTQGASGLGQANAVVAHPTGPSSLYFNPALLNEVTGRQVEIGTTGIKIKRDLDLDSGGTESSKDGWNFPSTAYYTHQVNDKLSTGFGLFSPFGLSTEWDQNYEGRYLGTYGEINTLDINPVLSYRATDKLSIAGGFSVLYLDATLNKNINQTVAYAMTDAALGGGVLPLLGGPLADIRQSFSGEGWGSGYNLGLLYRPTDMVSIGATYRSHIDVHVEGRASFSGLDANLAPFVQDTDGSADIRLPAQATAGIAVSPSDNFVVEAGVRWEDWSSTKNLVVILDSPVLGQSADITPRNWKATWSYNIGGQYHLTDNFALNAGYLFGENAVPDSTFEPMIPDADAHLFTLGFDWTSGPWTVSGAFGYEHHEDRKKNNTLGDPLGSAVASMPVDTANGNYKSKLYLVALSVGYHF